MHKRYQTWTQKLSCVWLFALALGLTTTAYATPELRALEPTIADLPLGLNRAALRGWLRGRLEASAPAVAASRGELAEKARMKGLREADLDRIMGGEVAFAGARTPWDASILTGEFGHGSGESLVVWQDEGATHYFFLAGGMLWKYARPLDAALTLPERARDWQRRLGRAPIAGGAGGDFRWDGKRHTFALIDRRAEHGADLMTVADREAERNLAPRRRPLEADQADKPDPVGDFLLAPGEE